MPDISPCLSPTGPVWPLWAGHLTSPGGPGPGSSAPPSGSDPRTRSPNHSNDSRRGQILKSCKFIFSCIGESYIWQKSTNESQNVNNKRLSLGCHISVGFISAVLPSTQKCHMHVSKSFSLKVMTTLMHSCCNMYNVGYIQWAVSAQQAMILLKYQTSQDNVHERLSKPF